MALPSVRLGGTASLLVGQAAAAVLVHEHREVAIELLRQIAVIAVVRDDREQPREVTNQRAPA